ncbi:MAG: hypothetical protein EOM30_01545 [Clostridia bacterium]|nr:hypothetical protein [Clostridia bacterium]
MIEKDNERSIEKITLQFSDGTTKTVEKGFICGFTENEIDGTIQSDMHLINVSGKELETVVLLVLELAEKLNLFNTAEDKDNEES